MSRIVIRDQADLINVLPSLVHYRPEEGSVIVFDSQGQPIGVLYPELLAEFNPHSADDDIRLASALRVFAGRNVLVFRIGYHAPLAFVKRALDLIGANVLTTFSISHNEIALAFAGTPTNMSREEFLAGGGKTVLDEGQDRADEFVKDRFK